MHGVDQQPEFASPNVFRGGQAGGEVTDGQSGHRFHDGTDAALGGKFGQRRELVEGARKVGVEAHHVDPRDAEFGHHVEVGPQRVHVGAGAHEESVAERDGYAAIVHRGEQILPERGVVLEGEGRVAEWHQRHALDGGRDAGAA
ncbi:hypothetical protein MPRI_45390 [Mycobacterium paraintracellulare]|uniref:Uncharacterized protein n=1 Tax=Mycobacterium paraintracellulare TaxID=1138383 RepID=A0ABN6AU65_9MYCO|nr:hypothetical protein MPRI_45390 [Mycobacterium paraintracellulare]BCO41807.1 hypothetical protein MINTM001_29460 [Mycobacterium paraintracellulare]